MNPIDGLNLEEEEVADAASLDIQENNYDLVVPPVASSAGGKAKGTRNSLIKDRLNVLATVDDRIASGCSLKQACRDITEEGFLLVKFASGERSKRNGWH